MADNSAKVAAALKARGYSDSSIASAINTVTSGGSASSAASQLSSNSGGGSSNTTKIGNTTTTYNNDGSYTINYANGTSKTMDKYGNVIGSNNYNNTSNTSTTPTINLGDLGKFGQDAYNTPNFNIDARNDAIIAGLGANATNRAAVEAYLNSNSSFANASQTDKENTINSILRKAATVATAQNPVVETNPIENMIPYDDTDPQDYLDRLQARTALTGQQLTQEEYYNMLKAQRAIQQQQYKNPYEDYLKQLQQQLAEAQNRERQRDEQALSAYTNRLNSEYSNLINQQNQMGEASKSAAQNVYSFSGFGRSSAAANKQAEIQESTNSAIQALNKQKLAEIELKRAELEGADGDELTYLKNQMNTYNQAATQWQLQALSQMAEANAAAGNDAVTNITNMLAAAANSGIDITGDGYERIITAFNGMTPEQQDAYLSTLSPTDQLLVLGGAANSADGNYKFVSATKYQKAGYFNEKTGEFFPLSGGGTSGSGGGNGGGGSGNWTGEAADIKNSTWEALNQLYNLTESQRSRIALAGDSKTIEALDLMLGKGTVSDTNANINYITKNLTLNKFYEAKKNGASFGSMSEGEWKILAEAASKLKLTLPEAAWKSTIQEIANKMGVSLSGAPTYNSTNTSTNTNNTSNNTTKTSDEQAYDMALQLLS